MADCILVKSSGVSEEAPKYEIGPFYGDIEGSARATLDCSTNGHVGNTAIFIIMHRDSITVDPSWTLETERSYTESGLTQIISIYKTVIINNIENFTITQNSTVRMCGCVYFFDKNVDIEFNRDVELQDSVYDMSDIDSLSLVVGNLIWVRLEPTESEYYVVNTNSINPVPQYAAYQNRFISFISSNPSLISRAFLMNQINIFYVFDIKY